MFYKIIIQSSRNEVLLMKENITSKKTSQRGKGIALYLLYSHHPINPDKKIQ